MKIIFIILTVSFSIACSSSPPKPPQPEGELSNVNPSEININDLIQKK